MKNLETLNNLPIKNLIAFLEENGYTITKKKAENGLSLNLSKEQRKFLITKFTKKNKPPRISMETLNNYGIEYPFQLILVSEVKVEGVGSGVLETVSKFWAENGFSEEEQQNLLNYVKSFNQSLSSSKNLTLIDKNLLRKAKKTDEIFGLGTLSGIHLMVGNVYFGKYFNRRSVSRWIFYGQIQESLTLSQEYRQKIKETGDGIINLILDLRKKIINQNLENFTS